jgi:HK97 family phage prohead protease
MNSETLLSPEVAAILARDADKQRHAEVRKRVDAEMLASRQRRLQRERDIDAQWRGRCEQRGIQPFARPRFRWSREDGVETLTMLGFEDRRTIWGCASTATITSHRTSKEPDGARVQMPIPLKCSHKVGAIGMVTQVRKSPKSLFIRAVLNDDRAADRAWDLICAGELQAFSVGSEHGTDVIVEVDGVKYVREWTLKEVSIVRTPANPDCWLRIYGHE